MYHVSYCEGWYLGTSYVAANKKFISELFDLILISYQEFANVIPCEQQYQELWRSYCVQNNLNATFPNNCVVTFKA